MKYCAVPFCRELVVKGRCATHAHQKNRETDDRRGSPSARGYTYQWAKVSAAFRNQHPICGERHDGRLDTVNSRCAELGMTVAATCVDHTVPLDQGGTNDETNLMSACAKCNTLKRNTIDRAGRQGKGRG